MYAAFTTPYITMHGEQRKEQILACVYGTTSDQDARSRVLGPLVSTIIFPHITIVLNSAICFYQIRVNNCLCE